MAFLPLYRTSKRGKPGYPDTWNYVVISYAQVPDHLLSHLISLPSTHWFISPGLLTNYAKFSKRASGKQTEPRLHNIIWELFHGPIPPDKTVDHIDFDGLNCMLSNLRLASPSEQTIHQRKMSKQRGQSAQSKYKGVSKYNSVFRSRPWSSVITIGNKIFLGCYPTEATAAFAYNVASLIIRPTDFNVLNTIPDQDFPDSLQQQEITIQVEARLRARGDAH